MAVVTKQQQFEYIVNAEHSPVDEKNQNKKIIIIIIITNFHLYLMFK